MENNHLQKEFLLNEDQMIHVHGEGDDVASVKDSILDTIKQMLGPGAEDSSFDVDIIIDINSAISRLTQLGVGPTSGYEIEDNSNTWVEFLNGDKRYGQVKTYIYLKTKLVFEVILIIFYKA